ncbi:MAG TPA: CDP-alcohol phosphatidyltransferase family protein, partial [Alphaproteobacteria bacterium]|nr:CDP-alcohol phosphatidyltransferase family protein [Alphaproteobacteria bacterium]
MTLKLAENKSSEKQEDTKIHPVRQISIIKIVPSLITLMALIAGVTAIQKAIAGDFETAIMMLLAAALFDVLDGAVARILKAQSEFGAQL